MEKSNHRCTSVWTCTAKQLDIATADPGREGEVRHVGSIGGDLASLDKYSGRFIQPKR